MLDHRMNAPDGWRELADSELYDLVRDRAMDALDEAQALDDWEFSRKGLSALTPAMAALYCVWLLDVEVCNGGFYQFFGNSSGMIGPEAREGLRLFGFPELAERVQAAISFAGFDPYPRDRDERWGRMPDLKKETSAWDDLADAYFGTRNGTWPYNSSAKELLTPKIANYIRMHPEVFFKLD